MLTGRAAARAGRSDTIAAILDEPGGALPARPGGLNTCCDAVWTGSEAPSSRTATRASTSRSAGDTCSHRAASVPGVQRAMAARGRPPPSGRRRCSCRLGPWAPRQWCTPAPFPHRRRRGRLPRDRRGPERHHRRERRSLTRRRTLRLRRAEDRYRDAAALHPSVRAVTSDTAHGD
jgi:hypothetical protein